MFKKIQKKMAVFFFPRTIGDLRLRLLSKDMEMDSREKKMQELLLELKALKKKEQSFSHADLLRANLGAYVVNLSAVEKDGFPKHFLDLTDKDKRALYINQLAQIFQMEVWDVMWKYHIDTQGNFIMRKADGDLQTLFGRATINGISLLRDEVQKGFDEYQEGRKPKDDFDPDEMTEGIIISKN